jgi:TPR repeat protein
VSVIENSIIRISDIFMTPLTRTKSKKGLKLPRPLSAPQELPTAPPIPIESVDPKDPLAIAIYYHEINQLAIAAYYFSVSAARGNPMGLIMYAIALRHGWGIEKNEVEAVKWLQSAADKALVDLDIVTCDYSKKSIRTNIQNKEQTKTVITDELIMAIFELAICFKQGWGVKKSAQTAAYYLNIAAQLGDSEAQMEMGELYLRGEGVKQDKKLAAKWFRQAEKNGARMVSMQWIWKPKYD